MSNYSAACLVVFWVVSKASFTKSPCSLLCLDKDPVAGEAASARPAYEGRENFALNDLRTSSIFLST